MNTLAARGIRGFTGMLKSPRRRRRAAARNVELREVGDTGLFLASPMSLRHHRRGHPRGLRLLRHGRLMTDGRRARSLAADSSSAWRQGWPRPRVLAAQPGRPCGARRHLTTAPSRRDRHHGVLRERGWDRRPQHHLQNGIATENIHTRLHDDLARMRPDVLVVGGPRRIREAMRVTTTIPVLGLRPRVRSGHERIRQDAGAAGRQRERALDGLAGDRRQADPVRPRGDPGPQSSRGRVGRSDHRLQPQSRSRRRSVAG